jgi:hypothetical protein
MIIFDEERPSDSPFVERIWCCHSEGAGPFLSIAESRCELVVTRLQGKITLTVRGPETKATPLGDCPAEGEWLGVRLKPGTFLPHLPTRNLVDAAVTLPLATSKSFWLGGEAWQFPDYENADTFVDWLVREGLLLREPVVGAVRPLTTLGPASFLAGGRAHTERGSANRTRSLCHAPLTARQLDPGYH